MNHIFLEKRICTSRTIKITALPETSVSGRIIGSYVYSIKLLLVSLGWRERARVLLSPILVLASV